MTIDEKIAKLKKFANVLGAKVYIVKSPKDKYDHGELIEYDKSHYRIYVYVKPKKDTKYDIMFTLIHEIAHLLSAQLETRNYQKVKHLLIKQVQMPFDFFSKREQRTIFQFEKHDFKWWFIINDLLNLGLTTKEIKRMQKKDENAYLTHLNYGKKKRKKS